MENIYPLFEQHRILKKEYLWALRDYSFGQIQLEYQAYADGILKGCQVEIHGNCLVVKPGMIKCKGFVYLLQEEQEIPYEATQQLEILKIRLTKDTYQIDQIRYEIHLYLDNNPERNDQEFELCRFELRKGAQLRNQYTDLPDMGTAYDTINPIFATWASIGRESLSPVITGYYGKALLNYPASDATDLAFAWTCLNTTEAVPYEILVSYVSRKIGKVYLEGFSCYQLFVTLGEILRKLQRGKGVEGDGVGVRKRIVVD